MIHIVKATSHWQGSRHHPVAIATDRETAVHVANLLSTCSFCSPGRTGSYQVGHCYTAATMRVRPRVPVLPADAILWERVDADAWFGQRYDEEGD